MKRPCMYLYTRYCKSFNWTIKTMSYITKIRYQYLFYTAVRGERLRNFFLIHELFFLVIMTIKVIPFAHLYDPVATVKSYVAVFDC